MIIFDVIYYVTIFFLPIAPYFLFFKHRQNRFYTNRDWLYLFKYLFAKNAVQKYQLKCKKSLDDETKKHLEQPKKIKSGIYSDNQFIYGVDQKGNSLSLRFSIQSNLVAEVFLCLRLSNGSIYTIPGENDTKLYSITNWHWKTKDLNIEIVEPFRILRISYNGLLCDKNNDVQHVQFHFLWIAAASPLYYPQDASTSLLVDALARQRWRDGDWISILGDERGYEQFGCLKGYVKGQAFEEELFLNLPSCRTRFWCSDENNVLDRSIHLFVAGKDGNLINLWIKGFKKGCTDLQYGSIIMSNGIVVPIQSTDVRLDCLGENQKVPSTFTVQVKANNKLYRVVFHLKKEKFGSYLINVSADCDLNTQQGKSLVEFWYNHGKRDSLPVPLLVENKTKELGNCYVCRFDEENAKFLGLSGGKGCSLALLTSIKTNEFVVPRGFIITTNAFRKQLELNFNMNKAVSILDDICCKRVKGNLEHACEETVKTFENEDILSNIKTCIIEALEGMQTPECRWAVRSSAIGEDSEELSAAGQNETFLGCSTTEEILRSILKCWASLFSYQSVKYRHQHGVPIGKSQMAVVVQKMVPSESAGVLFTCHPSNGNPAKIVITANHGLGESVVSGKTEPDTVIIDRSWTNKLRIESKELGSKEKMIKMVDHGVQEVSGIEDFSITDDQALRLAKVGTILEEKFGGPRDIEWSFFENNLYLLQSRPITTLNQWSNYELGHEFDVATLSEDLVFTIANTGEVLPGAISALTTSTLIRLLDQGVQKSMFTQIPDSYALKCLSTFQHHLFLDVIGGIHRKVDKNITLQSKILDLAVFGHPVINEQIHSLAIQRFGVLKPIEKIWEMVSTIKLAWNNKANTELTKRHYQNTEILIDKDRDNLKDIYEKIEKSLKIFVDMSKLHCLTSRTSITYQFFAMMVLTENAQNFNNDHYSDVAAILSSCDDVVSAEIPNRLANITNILVKNHQNEEFASLAPNDGRKWLQENSPEASKIFEQFLVDHGHRTMREFDLFSKTWRKNPSEVVKMIQTNCKISSTKTGKVPQTVNEVIAALKSPKKALTKKILKFIIKKSRTAVGLREQTKSETIRLVDKFRTAYSYLGEKMALNGSIPTAELIYHLTHYEIGLILDGCERSPVLITKALKRQKLYPMWDEIKFPEISYGIPSYEKRDFVPRTGVGKILCQGTPVCTGIIKARACVITDLAKIGELQEGDVLITYCTDIGWSPYFPMLGGIVTELGGLVSHGAVIAREYGLPCIVGAKGATSLFKTGDIVVLAGQRGTIELV